jgi:hypothetical protein
MPRIEQHLFRVREVVDVGADAIYVGSHGLLLVDADLTPAERAEAVSVAPATYGPHVRLVKG